MILWAFSGALTCWKEAWKTYCGWLGALIGLALAFVVYAAGTGYFDTSFPVPIVIAQQDSEHPDSAYQIVVDTPVSSSCSIIDVASTLQMRTLNGGHIYAPSVTWHVNHAMKSSQKMSAVIALPFPMNWRRHDMEITTRYRCLWMWAIPRVITQTSRVPAKLE